MPRPRRNKKLTKRAEAAAGTEQLLSQICDPKVAKNRKRNTVQAIPVEKEAVQQLRN
jgi:hypothetical protein